MIPLQPTTFQRALATGHGRALGHIRAFGIGDYGAMLLDACRRSLVYDYQTEGGRAEWLIEMVDAADLTEELRGDLLSDQWVFDDEAPYWDIYQRCELLKVLAMRGDSRARKSLYDMCRPARESADVFACDEIIEVDGAEGLIFVARRLGNMLVEDPRLWYTNEVLDSFDDRHGAGSARAILTPLAVSDPDIDRYLREVDVRMQQWNSAGESHPKRAGVRRCWRRFGPTRRSQCTG